MVNSKYAIFFITLLFNLSLQIYYFRPNPLTFVALKEAKESMMKSILIIEDDITFGMMLKTWLSKKGLKCRQSVTLPVPRSTLKDKGQT